ncbi:tetratricopeptide repeat protein [Amycolatopsis sp. EV170708-02-1]|uniref:tetratricopeptide repeat protein n=1 Tax=Amycolatopsis sp. EV170708-02-1 TaxID=2919322 RepID=UPI001F0BBD76|nr:tetratricopeptide repeat protein [Amycolatopsis sp. EV170708-02-1]UMP00032.1 tetratricopeptide repeat protein [Amycolatopsis sp. EV170708-02-1]
MHATHGGAAVAAVGGDFHFHQAAVPSAAAVVTTITGSTQVTRERFVGRAEQVTQLLELLDPVGQWPGPIVVSGMGGLGKTALASHTAAATVDRGWFPGGVLFVDLRGYDLQGQHVRPQQVFASMLRILAPDSPIPATLDEQATAYHQVLDRLATRERRVLLVLDNVATSTQIVDLLPQSGSHRVLVTSRDTFSVPAARQFALDVLKPEDALRLLTDGLVRRFPGDQRAELEPDAAHRIAVTVCGALPLALEITTAVLTGEPDLSIADLITELTAPDGTGVHRLSDGERIVATVIDQSWHRLRARHPDAARLLPLLTLNPGPDFHTDAAAALTGQPSATTVAWLRTLRHANLLHHTGNGRWAMHDLIRSHARDHLHDTATPDPSAATLGLLAHYVSATAAADRHLRVLPGDSLPGRFTGRAEALAWLDAERANLTAAVVLALAARCFEIAGFLADCLGAYLKWRRHISDLVTTSEHALTAARQLDDLGLLSSAWNNVGVALQEAGNSDGAIAALRKARDTHQELGDLHGEGLAWNNLGNTLRNVERFDEALTAHRKALDIFQKIGGLHSEGDAWHNLGNTLRDVERFDEALTALQKAHEIYQELGDLHGEGIAWNNLGNTLRNVERFDEALTAYRKAREIHQRLDDRHNEGNSWDGLGCALQAKRRFDEALTAHCKARDIHQELDDRHNEGKSWNNIGLVLQEMRRFDDAITAHSRALDIYQAVGDRCQEGLTWCCIVYALEELEEVMGAKAAEDAFSRVLTTADDTYIEDAVQEAMEKMDTRRSTRSPIPSSSDEK